MRTGSVIVPLMGLVMLDMGLALSVPSALFSVGHNICGALLSTNFHRTSEKQDRELNARQVED